MTSDEEMYAQVEADEQWCLIMFRKENEECENERSALISYENVPRLSVNALIAKNLGIFSIFAGIFTQKR